MKIKNTKISLYNNTKNKNIILEKEILKAVNISLFSLENTIQNILLLEDGISYFEKLTNIINTLTLKDNFSKLLQMYLNDEIYLAVLQKNSYYHNNGFDKFVLFNNAHFKLRLHFFKGEENTHKTHENIHNHRWNFASKMLKGHFDMKFWAENPTGEEEVLEYEYVSAKGGNKFETALKGTQHLTLLETQRISADTLYYMPAELLHQITTINKEGAVTLILTGTDVSSTCKLFAKDEIMEQHKINQKFSLEQIKIQLSNVCC